MNIVDTAKSLFNLPQPDEKTTVWFILDGREYEVHQFSIKFTQPTDFKGEPQHEILGGQLVVTLTETIGESIYGWAIRPSDKKSGEVVFRTESSNAKMRVTFTDAYCVTLNREIDGEGGGIFTTLVLSPSLVKLNGIEHDNFWGE